MIFFNPVTLHPYACTKCILIKGSFGLNLRTRIGILYFRKVLPRMEENVGDFRSSFGFPTFCKEMNNSRI